MNLIIILILYTIILLFVIKYLLPDSLFLNIDPDSVHFLYNGKKWFEYRLGDLFYNPHLVNLNDHCKRFPYSIATEYSNNEIENKGIEKIKKVINNKLLKKDDLILHLRIGDIIDKYPEFHKKQYFKDQEWWESLVKYINDNKIKRIILMAGAHMPECLEKSWEYLEMKRTFFESNNIKTMYRLACSPDEDILYSCKAKYFATTGGQYGKFLSEIIKSYGGKVFNSVS
jgi:hypothetical protein